MYSRAHYYLLFLEKRLKVNAEPTANNNVAIDATKPVFVVSPVSGNALASAWAGSCDWVCCWLFWVATLLSVAWVCCCSLFWAFTVFSVASSWLLELLLEFCCWPFKNALPSSGTMISVLSTCSPYFKFWSTYSW